MLGRAKALKQEKAGAGSKYVRREPSGHAAESLTEVREASACAILPSRRSMGSHGRVVSRRKL